MCDNDFASPTSLDLADLLEYDEFQSYETNNDEPTDQIALTDNPLPLSEELALAASALATASANTTPGTSSVTNDGSFTKSSELFLRFDNVAAEGQLSDGGPKTSDSESMPNGAFGIGIELQYENEFDDDECGIGGGGLLDGASDASRSFHSLAGNENEQLLMEGSRQSGSRLMLFCTLLMHETETI